MRLMLFLMSKQFARYYSVLTLIVLATSLVSVIIGFLGDIVVQLINGALTIIGIVLLFGQILLAMNRANRSNKVGWVMVRFTYVTLFVTSLGLLSMAGSAFIASFYLLGGNSILSSVFFSTVGYTLLASFGLCLSAVCYHTLAIDQVWL